MKKDRLFRGGPWGGVGGQASVVVAEHVLHHGEVRSVALAGAVAAGNITEGLTLDDVLPGRGRLRRHTSSTHGELVADPALIDEPRGSFEWTTFVC